MKHALKFLLLYACCLVSLAATAWTTTNNAARVRRHRPATTNATAKVSRHATTNTPSKITYRAGVTSNETSRVLALATPANFALLNSTNAQDAAARLDLQRQLAEAALRDACETEKGRLKWHGPYVQQRINMTNETATYVHADGTTRTVKFQRPNLKREVAKANARLPQPPMTNGVPVALAHARMRRYHERLHPNQTITTEIHANRPPQSAR